MTREAELLARWASDKEVYEAWGSYLVAEVKAALADHVSDVEYFLKLPVKPRLKDDHKLVEKAFYRPGKNYADPYVDITDKAGIRFVVLLGTDMRTVEAALTSLPDCQFSRDRDHEEEQKKKPIEFDYAAIHYIVRPARDLAVGAIVVPAGTPCEVQIKTILQHAYSELTHDTIYKPQVETTPTMQRNAAKSMALLEATNDYFQQVDSDVSAALASVREITKVASETYRNELGVDAKPSAIEGLLASAFEAHFDGDYRKKVGGLLEAKPFLRDAIRRRLDEKNPIFAQPSVLLVYLVAAANYHEALKQWPLTTDQIEPLLNDLGESAYG